MVSLVRLSIDRREFLRSTLALASTAGTFATAWADESPASGATHITAQQARELQESTLVVDGLDPSNLRDDYLDMLKAGGVHCWHQSLAGDLANFAALLKFLDNNKDRIAQAGSVREIRELRNRGVISHISGWQSADGLVTNGEPVPGNLRAFHDLGLRICGIAYNVANVFGGGCLDPQVGLTRAGHRLVEEIHLARMVLDLAGHTNEATSFDAIAISAGIPVICTHTNLRSLNDNPRCSTDRMLEAIAGTGGVIGLSAFNDFHARKASDLRVPRTPQVGLDRHLDQYDYLKRLVGVDHIGIGPDFIHGNNSSGRVSDDESLVMAPEAYSPETPWFYVKGFENIAELPNLTQGLLQRGWSSADVRKVLGENWLRVYERVWGS
jgi:membrane dipeptidase